MRRIGAGLVALLAGLCAVYGAIDQKSVVGLGVPRAAISARHAFVVALQGRSFLFNPSQGINGAPFLRSVYRSFGFSHDDRYFLYLRANGERPTFALHVYDVNSGADRLITPERVHYAAWSPTSLIIGFIASGPAGTLRLYSHDLQTGRSGLIDEGMLNPEFLEWSPNGEQLLYGSRRPLTADNFHDQAYEYAIHEYGVNGRGRGRVSDGRVARYLHEELVVAGERTGEHRSLGSAGDSVVNFRSAANHTFATVVENGRSAVKHVNADGSFDAVTDGEIVDSTDDGVVVREFTPTGVTFKYLESAASMSAQTLSSATDYKLPFAGSAYLVQGGAAYSGGACDGRACQVVAHTNILSAALDWQQTIEEGQGNGHILAIADGTVSDLLNTVTCNSVTTTCLVGYDDYSRTCKSNGGTGNYVVLAHGDGSFSMYAHLKSGSIPLTVGQFVSQGTFLGEQGHSGSAHSQTGYHICGDHLHFQRQNTGTGWSQSIPTDFSEAPCSLSCMTAYVSSNIENGTSTGGFSLTLTPSTVVGGVTTVANSVALGTAAPAGGTTVDLSSSDPTVASVPSAVTVLQGSTNATFPITTTGVSGATPVAITAYAATLAASATASLSVTPPTVAKLTFSKTTTIGATPITGNEVALSGPAPSGGTAVTFTSSNSAVAWAPVTVTVPAGSTYASFTISCGVVTTSTQVTITASSGGVSKSGTITVQPLALQSLTVPVTTVVGGNPLPNNYVRLTGWAPVGGLAVTLNSSSPAVSPPSAVTVPEGVLNSPKFAIPTTPVTANTTAVISASYGSVTKSVTVTVTPASLSSVTLSPTSVAGGGTTTANYVTLSGPAPSGGAVVMLTSSNPVATLPASVTVAGGAVKSPTFSIVTSGVAASTPVVISASYAAVTKSATLTVLPTTAASVTLSPTSVAGGKTTTANSVTLNGPAPAGGAVVTLTSSNAAATLPATVTVAAGAVKSPTFSIVTSNVPVSTPVVISASYGGVTKSATLTVLPTVVASITLSPTSVVGGGTTTASYVNLNGPAPPGGAVVTLTSNNPVATPQATVTVAGGVTKSAKFSIVTSSVPGSTPVVISASYGGVTKSATLTVLP